MPNELVSTFEKNQSRGLKAALNNPRVSAPAKDRAQQRLDEMAYQPDEIDYEEGEKLVKDSPFKQQVRIDDSPDEEIPAAAAGQEYEFDEIDMAVQQGKKESNVVRGYKATLKNPNASEETKMHAESVLERHDQGAM
ncbi:hypothetical protein CVT24_013406 [Panaeolus cyanescens]|uniref:Uncharacterized protein n=1 Tax=Panaeolus cyanescens TaxID=181874 RepID=A0A409YMJ5_9AGAR|nr:hypothetical protein CVT24_013406 [Panaeolus cyanescens]